MTDDLSALDTLRPEVTGLGPCKLCGATGYALSYGGIDICPACDVGMNPEVTKLKRENTELRAELLRLTDDCARLVDCINAQPPTRRSLIDRAERAEAELAAIKARIAEAPAAQVLPFATLDSPHGASCVFGSLPVVWIGKSVRVVLDE